ncbi:hypothetical protein TWF696_002257 [Orbilia brochopaga]|uniref:Uncharacterized protein n=1 Tax=Orbilia brochopaga TaxID=3140254 RepID=A0AAV9U478_9PEZI
MGCAASKQELGRRLKAGRKNDMEIGSPTDFKHSALSYPSTLCIECDLPSRALLDSLGNTDISLCCSCGDSDTLDLSLGLEVDLKPLSPITLSPLYSSSPPQLSPLSLPAPFELQELEEEDEEEELELGEEERDVDITLPVQQQPLRRELPTAYNFDFNFVHRSRDACVCLDPYIDEDDEEDDEEPIQPTHKRCESFHSRTWTVDHKVVVTAKEVPACPGSSPRVDVASRSDSFASLRNGLRSAAAMLGRNPEPEPFVEQEVDDDEDDDDGAAPAPTVKQGIYVPKTRMWGGKARMSFDMLNQSTPDLLSAYARKSQRVSKDEVKIVRIRGVKSALWF